MSFDIGAPSHSFDGTLSGVPIALGHPVVQMREQRTCLGTAQAVEQCIDQKGS